MSSNYSHDHLRSVWYYSKPSEDPYFSNQYVTNQELFLALDLRNIQEYLTVGQNNFRNKIPCLLHCLFSEDTNSKIIYTINFIRHSKLRLSTHCHYFFPLIILTLFFTLPKFSAWIYDKRENHKKLTSTISSHASVHH